MSKCVQCNGTGEIKDKSVKQIIKELKKEARVLSEGQVYEVKMPFVTVKYNVSFETGDQATAKLLHVTKNKKELYGDEHEFGYNDTELSLTMDHWNSKIYSFVKRVEALEIKYGFCAYEEGIYKE